MRPRHFLSALMIAMLLFVLPGRVLGVSAGAFTGCPTMTVIHPSECTALVALYNSSAGASWSHHTNWLANDDPSTWYGVAVFGGNVTGLELPNNVLNGTIPHELGNLTYITTLRLGGNKLTGSLPPELGNLSNLTKLWLFGNNLTGSIPPQLGNLSKLQILSLGLNKFTGSIPADLNKLTNLRTLDLAYNQLSGRLPTELSALGNLIDLELDYNSRLYGSIPTSSRP